MGMVFSFPFSIVEGKGWCAAAELEDGDVLRTQDGETEIVSKVEVEQLDEAVKVYNLEIEDSHTYYVSADEVLVHNQCGKWIDVNEGMSDFSRDYQTQITGETGKAYVQNGVKFDGIKDGTLIDAKAKYSNFVNKKTGEFYSWFKGKFSFLSQAERQLKAAEGAKIQWYFAEEISMNAVMRLFQENGISGIELIFQEAN